MPSYNILDPFYGLSTIPTIWHGGFTVLHTQFKGARLQIILLFKVTWSMYCEIKRMRQK